MNCEQLCTKSSTSCSRAVSNIDNTVCSVNVLPPHHSRRLICTHMRAIYLHSQTATVIVQPTLSCLHSHAYTLMPTLSCLHSHGGSLLSLSWQLAPLALTAARTSCPQAAAHNVLLVSPRRDIYQLTTAATASIRHPHLEAPHYKPIWPLL